MGNDESILIVLYKNFPNGWEKVELLANNPKKYVSKKRQEIIVQIKEWARYGLKNNSIVLGHFYFTITEVTNDDEAFERFFKVVTDKGS